LFTGWRYSGTFPPAPHARIVFGDTPSIDAACLTRTKPSISSTIAIPRVTFDRLTVSDKTLTIVAVRDNQRASWHERGSLLTHVILIHDCYLAVAARWGYRLPSLEAGKLLVDTIPQTAFHPPDSKGFSLPHDWSCLIEKVREGSRRFEKVREG